MSSDPFKLEAERLDATDPLREFRNEFHLPSDGKGEPLIYLCGHSLGLQPKKAQQLVENELESWRRFGVEAHFSGERPWVSYHERFAAPLASLAGAMPSEVVAMNSLSVNLHLMLVSFFRPSGERSKILIEQSAFPSDRYAVRSQLHLQGLDPADALIELTPRPGESLLRDEDIFGCIEREGPRIATVLLPGVNYLTGQRFDLKNIASAARRAGCTVGFDLAHAIGNVPLNVHDSGADFAVWCSYKYLNGGPGAVGGAFIHDRHAESSELPRLAGWWGHDKRTRFEMPDAFAPLRGAEGWQISNPPILAMAPLEASLALFQRATLAALRTKSEQLTNFLGRALARRLEDRIRIVTPSRSDARGSQLSLILNIDSVRAKEMRLRLHEAGIVCDWREPNIVRVAPVPLYNTFRDAWKLVAVLEEISA